MECIVGWYRRSQERKERVLEVPESLMELSFVDCSDVDGEEVDMDSSFTLFFFYSKNQLCKNTDRPSELYHLVITRILIALIDYCTYTFFFISN